MAEDTGEPSTHSTRLLVDWRAREDAELVARFKRAGVVIVGRTNTPELGIYGVTEPRLRGPCRNPWNVGHTPGGSSGGAGSAVSARMVPMAHGGDGGGSIRIPSAHCGLFGLKPTRARNPAGPMRGEGWGGLVSEHVLTRSVRDSAAMLDATHGPDLGAPYHVLPPERPFLDEVGADPGKLRIGFTKDALLGDENHADCVAAVEGAAALAAKLGHDVEEACPDFDKDALVRAYLITVATGSAAGVRDAGAKAGREARASDLEAPTWLLRTIGETISAAEYAHQRGIMHAASRKIAAFFERYDVLITSTAARPPVPVGEFDVKPSEAFQLALLRTLPLKALLLKALDELAASALSATPNTMLFNMTGQPAVSIPLHWNDAGLPIGTQWVSRFGDEATLFRLGAQLEQAQPWSDKKPPLLA